MPHTVSPQNWKSHSADAFCRLPCCNSRERRRLIIIPAVRVRCTKSYFASHFVVNWREKSKSLIEELLYTSRSLYKKLPGFIFRNSSFRPNAISRIPIIINIFNMSSDHVMTGQSVYAKLPFDSLIRYYRPI